MTVAQVSEQTHIPLLFNIEEPNKEIGDFCHGLHLQRIHQGNILLVSVTASVLCNGEGRTLFFQFLKAL